MSTTLANQSMVVEQDMDGTSERPVLIQWALGWVKCINFTGVDRNTQIQI